MVKVNKTQFLKILDESRNANLPNINMTPLNENNWVDWKFVFVNHLVAHGFYQFLVDDYEDEVLQLDSFKKIDRLIFSQIGNNVSIQIRRDLYHLSSAREAWTLIGNRFEGNDYIKCIRTFRKLVEIINFKNNDLGLILSEFNSFINEISLLFPTHDTKIWIGLLFALIPDKYSYLSSVIRSNDNLTLADAIDMVSSELQLNKERNKSNLSNQHKLSSANYSSTITNKEVKVDLFCKYCKKKGHNIKSCMKLKEKNKNKSDNQNSTVSIKTDVGQVKLGQLVGGSGQNKVNNANNGQIVHSSGVQDQDNPTVNHVSITNFAIKTVNIFSVNELIKSDVWYFDTGAQHHTSNNLIGCCDFVKTEHIYVNSAHGTHNKALGLATFNLKSSLGEIIKIRDVIIDPSLEASYISGGLLDQLGFTYTGGNGMIKVYSKDKLLVIGRQVSTTLYELEFEHQLSINSIHSNVNSLYEWHLKFGHLNISDLKKVLDFYKINYVKSNDFKCQDCLLAKCTIKPFYASQTRSTDILQLIHTDLSGIVRIKNILGVHYFLVFLDDFSRMLFVYLIKNKSEVYETFITFKNWIELKTGKKIKVLRSDNGTEYANHLFNQMASETGIELQYSVARRQQQNGASERCMRTLAESATAMIIASGSSNGLWPFAISTAAYLRNRSPNSSINYEIPYFKFFGIKPKIDHLIPFNSTVIIKNDQSDNKFSPRGKKGIMVGYSTNHKAYTILIPESNQLVNSRDVNVVSFGKSDMLVGSSTEFVDIQGELSDDDTEMFDDTVRIYSDGSTNHLIRDITEVSETLNQDLINDDSAMNSDISVSTNNESISSSGPVSDGESSVNSEEVDPATTNEQNQENLIHLNRTQKINFINENPNVKLTYLRGSRVKGRGKISVYKVNSITVPNSLESALNGPEAEQWAAAAIEEIHSLESNHTWDLVPRPTNVKVIPGMFCFSVKYAADLSIDRYKVRWVAKGCALDKDESDYYSPVLRGSSFNILMSLATNLNLKVYQLDVQTAFLNGEIKEDVYITQPYGFEDLDHPNFVCKLRKALYGLRQSAKTWFEFISKLLIEFGLRQSLSDRCIFFREDWNLIIGLYVDDFMVLVKDHILYEQLKEYLSKHVILTDKGLMKFCLGMNVHQQNSKILVNQSTAILNLLKEFNMSDCNGVRTPMLEKFNLNSTENIEFENRTLYRKLLGSLLHIAVHSRPDISYSVTRLCGFVVNPMIGHYEAAKRILRYLKSTLNYSLKFVKSNASIEAYADADWANDQIRGKSISGNLIYLYGNLVYWQSKKQNYVALHTCESELLSTREATSFVVYLRNFIYELNLMNCLKSPSIIYNDNESAVTTANGGGQFIRNKHYLIRANFIQDYISKNYIKVLSKPGKCMKADGLTKPLGFTLFDKFVKDLDFEIFDFNLDHVSN